MAARQRELQVRAAWAAQTQLIEPYNALEMREQHLDLHAVAARVREPFGLGEVADTCQHREREKQSLRIINPSGRP